MATIKVSAEELEKLAEDEGPDVRETVARNENTPISVLEKLAKDEVWYVRACVAENENIPISVLEKLAEDEHKWVREGVERNEKAPTAILEKLAKDQETSVRACVARNENTPISVLEKLAKDEVWYVRACVAENENIPISVLEKLAEDEHRDVRKAVARNENTPISVLEKLAEDEHKWVREGVARNENTPISVLKKLKVTNKEEILEMNRLLKVIFPNFPRGYLDEIINKKDTKNYDELKYDMRKFSDEDEFSITLKGEKHGEKFLKRQEKTKEVMDKYLYENEDNSNENTKDEDGDHIDITDFMVDPNDEAVIFSDSIEVDKSIQEKVIAIYKDIYDSDITGLKEMASSDYEYNRWIFYYPDREEYDQQ